ncbi:hypothetical protein P152DRAFT_440365 [Eremomyces bilateralis CBS 781.70]|uniref:Uncharacterized protein n=1 Tax=Eremomyces bilateralis CBS 781.70 TaxID=1392243 RepID=A0A6G1FX11_9PEZI|nr:uncharacterized protein P152DRAFT_440365 [Eremomyces bilateralis CBS 781.70]KAF1810206.1 hypothetical protein P152DRAFT_440365 [Eremomyces bilateralis CBS 781.70]
MATAAPATRPHDRNSRRRPFAWMKRLANLKTSGSPVSTDKKSQLHTGSPSKKHATLKNNPYPESGHLHRPSGLGSPNGRSFSTRRSQQNGSYTSFENAEHHHTMQKSNKSTAPTVATNPGTIHSDAGQSKAGTSATGAGGISSLRADSTFSSPNHSDQSLTTTLTTIQSTTPSGFLAAPTNANPHPGTGPNFSHQYPVSPVASAIPSHLTMPHPHTYNAATANNVLSDNASIITLASSSKARRRRNSLDTDASVRALFGASRESLPLSFFSTTAVDPSISGAPPGSAGLGAAIGTSRPSIASAERASVYSANGALSGPAGVIGSERNSIHTPKNVTDGGSIRSAGLGGHGRAESLSGSITGIMGGLGNPVTSAKENKDEIVEDGEVESEKGEEAEKGQESGR